MQHSEGALGLDWINIGIELPADGGDPQHSVTWSDDTSLVMLLGMLEMAKDTIIRDHMDGDNDA